MVIQQRHQRYKDSIRLSSRKPIPSIVAPSTAIENIRKFSKKTFLKNDRHEVFLETDESQRTNNIQNNYKDGFHSLGHEEESDSMSQSIYDSDDDDDFGRPFFDFRKCIPAKLRKKIVLLLVAIFTIKQFLMAPYHDFKSDGFKNIDDDGAENFRSENSSAASKYFFWPFVQSEKKKEKREADLTTKKGSEDISHEIMMQYAPKKSNRIPLQLDRSNDMSSMAENSPTLSFGIKSPIILENLGDLTEAYDPRRESPFFWNIKLTGEKIITDIFGKCYQLTRACEFGLQQPIFNEFSLEVFKQDGMRFVNVDTASVDGLERAKKLKLSKSHLADVIESRALPGIATKHLFSPRSKGRMFVLFRNPVDRAVDMYYYLADASWDPNYNPKLKKMDLIEYAQSKYIENNYVTRSLVGKFDEELSEDDMATAKQIVTTKCLVGLYENLDGSIQRFARYFGWSSFDTSKEKSVGIKRCRRAHVEAGDTFLNFPPVKKGSVEYDLILEHNRFDMELYEFITLIYKIQGEKIFNIV